MLLCGYALMLISLYAHIGISPHRCMLLAAYAPLGISHLRHTRYNTAVDCDITLALFALSRLRCLSFCTCVVCIITLPLFVRMQYHDGVMGRHHPPNVAECYNG